MENQTMQPPAAQSPSTSAQVPHSKFWKGFFIGVLTTVIACALVVAAIFITLGLMARASLEVAREKGSEAFVKASISNARVGAEISYDTTGSYKTACSDSMVVSAIESAQSQPVVKGVSCFADEDSYIIGATMVANDVLSTYCVDSAGRSAVIERPHFEFIIGPDSICR